MEEEGRGGKDGGREGEYLLRELDQTPEEAVMGCGSLSKDPELS